jgi:phosphinothricin acetyltransferase
VTRIRPARTDDLPAVAAIYNVEVEQGVGTFDTEPKDPDHFAHRLDAADARDVFLVADDAGEVVGFAYSGPFRPRPAYAATRETSIYLASAARGRGVGRALYAALLAHLDAGGVHTTMAVIALPNDASEALHASLGFERVGVLREVGHKLGRWVDTAWWQRLA